MSPAFSPVSIYVDEAAKPQTEMFSRILARRVGFRKVDRSLILGLIESCYRAHHLPNVTRAEIKREEGIEKFDASRIYETVNAALKNAIASVKTVFVYFRKTTIVIKQPDVKVLI